MPSLDRVLIVLKTIYENPPLTVYEIQKLTPLPKSTTYRVLEYLRQQGFIDENDGKIYLTSQGLRLIQIL